MNLKFIFISVLLSFNFIFCQENLKSQNAVASTSRYTNPFVPIYCKGDDLSYALKQPEILYEEVTNSKIEIQGMPAYKTQGELGECRAYALATLLQYYTCQKWKGDIPDCKNPPEDTAISYFGLLIYTNRSVEEDLTFQADQEKARAMTTIIEDLSISGNRLILENSRNYNKIFDSFSTSGQAGLDKRDEFISYLKNTYNAKKNTNITLIANCEEYVTKINNIIGLDLTNERFKKALTKESFDKFMYVIFFDGCKKEAFPAGFRPIAYPDDAVYASHEDIIIKTLEGLKKGKPVMFPSLCVSQNEGDDCSLSHALVVSGYKKVENPYTGEIKEVFKVHNSWGENWQKINNDGWMDAKVLVSNFAKKGVRNTDSIRIASASVIWLEP